MLQAACVSEKVLRLVAGMGVGVVPCCLASPLPWLRREDWWHWEGSVALGQALCQAPALPACATVSPPVR